MKVYIWNISDLEAIALGMLEEGAGSSSGAIIRRLQGFCNSTWRFLVAVWPAYSGPWKCDMLIT
jgi:hypothetical protein